MLARTTALRRAALAATATPRFATRQLPAATRTISVWPFRKKADPTLPVYFPQAKSRRQPPWRKMRYAVFTIMVYYALSQIYMSVVLDPLLDWAEAEWDSLSEKEKQELEDQTDEEEDEPILFLPFPFTTKKTASPPYKGTDPEWQEFLKLNKDPKKQKEIKTNLAEAVRRALETNGQLSRFMGGKNLKVRKMWLDILYPPAPPPKHYISGLILDWDGLFWGERSIESLAAHQLDAIMYPKAVALSVWTFWNVLLKRTSADISKALGLGGAKEPETSWQTIVINRGKDQQTSENGQKPNFGSILTPPSAPPAPAKAAQSTPFPGPLDLVGLSKKNGEGGGGEVPMSASMMQAFQAASLTLAKNWKPPSAQAVNRGCVRVDGLVEYQGKNAVMVVYVIGWYDPKTKKYMNVQTQLKHMIHTKQKPMGGP